MATSLVATPGQLQACILRAVRLDASCVPLSGSTDIVTTSALVSLQATPDVDEATKFEVKNACGKLAWTQESGCDKIKRFNLTMELATYDYELLSLLTGAQLITAKSGVSPSGWASKTIGISMPGIDTACTYGVALEVFTKTAYSTGACTETNGPTYVRHIFPRAFLTPGERSFENDVATMKLSGYATANPAFTTGSTNDWNGSVQLNDSTAYAQIFTNQLPSLSNSGTFSQGGGFA